VLRLHTTRLSCATIGCFLLAAAGCQFHRTGHGFIVQSQWSLEYDNTPRLALNTEAVPTGNESGLAHIQPAKPTLPKPELLPWHAHPRGYRLAGRIFKRGEPDTTRLSGAAVDQTTDMFARGVAFPPPPDIDPLPSRTHVPEKKGFRARLAKDEKVEFPDQVLLQPESQPGFGGEGKVAREE
jgi:hypothetical protein